ncbi:MAG: nuclear transport factor 2 family protein [Fidelibacterota bacterium]|nr:MAG: nuclear transport factor 2 family protein [Candidatus Neomarinimicrobiota bacterium]
MKSPQIGSVLIPLYASVLFLTCCSSSIDVDAEQAALLQTDRDFNQASLDYGAAEAVHMYLADGAIMLSGGGEPITGKETIYQLMAAGAGNVLVWIPRRAEVSRNGELGWTWGTYEVRAPGAKNGPALSSGNYVNIWRKQEDGTWKVIVDIGSVKPPPKD